MPGRILRRVRQRASAAGASNRPHLSRMGADFPTPAPPPLFDAAPILEAHPTWWQVHRIEVKDGADNPVLIAEFRDESDAFRFVATQLSRCRIRKWGSRVRDYVSMKSKRVP
jgi:hypothetical protein